MAVVDWLLRCPARHWIVAAFRWWIVVVYRGILLVDCCHGVVGLWYSGSIPMVLDLFSVDFCSIMMAIFAAL